MAAVFAPAPAEASAERAVHLLEYIAVDYPAAVVNGQVVSELEFDEQISFLALVGDQLREIGVAQDDALLGELAELEASVRAKGGEEVSTAARRLAGSIRQRFRVATLPPRVPDLAAGKVLFAEACASCHGETGRGDGPKGVDQDPPPADFTDRERALTLPLSAAFATITYGIEGTAMAGFEDAYDDAQRFDLAFYVGSLSFDAAEVTSGLVIVDENPRRAAKVVHNIGQLVREPVSALAPGDEELAIVAYLRAHPEALVSSNLSFSLVRTRLAESRDAYVSGDAKRGIDLSIAAYLDGFEPLEPALSAVDHALRTEIEADFLRYRERMQNGAPADEITALHAALRHQIDAADDLLASGGFGPTAVFVSSLTVLAREGLEAILLVVALIGILLRSGQGAAVRYVHFGWIGALVAGLATWALARFAIDIGGFERELIEGVTSLVAMAILFYVSYWLIAKVSSQRWQAFLQRRIQTALGSGSLWTLAGISFVAVYREAFETLLFFEAIAAQGGPEGVTAMWAGAGTGALLLLALAAGTFRFGLRLPMRQFFVASSGLLYLFSVMLAGHGIAALQEAGVVPLTSVDFVRIEWLGLYPTREGLALQGLLVVAAIVAGVRAIVVARTPLAAGEERAAPVSRN